MSGSGHWAREHAERVATARYVADEQRARDALRHLILRWEDDGEILAARVVTWINEAVSERDDVELAPAAEDRSHADGASADETVPEPSGDCTHEETD